MCAVCLFFRTGFGTLYLLDNRKTWPLTVKPHLTTPFCFCFACAFEQSSRFFIYLEPLGACPQASFRRIKLSITVCQLLQKRNRIFSFLPLSLHWKSMLLTQPSHLFTDTRWIQRVDHSCTLTNRKKWYSFLNHYTYN